MNELNLLKKLESYKAPPDFEERVLAQLSLRKRRSLKLRQLRFSLAGAICFAVILIVAVNIFILPRKSPLEFAEIEKGLRPGVEKGESLGTETIPIIETVDYRREMQTISPEPRTIYILEQVTEAKSAEIRY